MKKLFLTYLDVVLKFFGVQRIVKPTNPVIRLNITKVNKIIDKCEGRETPTVSKWDKRFNLVSKFFGLQKFTKGAEVITEKEPTDPKLERFNEILATCDKTHGPTGPKWDVDKNRPMFIEPDVIDEHNLDPNRSSKKDYKTLIDDEHKESLWKLKKQDPLYVNGITRRKARAKIVGENTNTKARQQLKSKATLTPEDETFESLRNEILKNIADD